MQARYYNTFDLEAAADADCSFPLRSRNSHHLIIIIIMLSNLIISQADAQYTTSHCVTLPKITLSVVFRLVVANGGLVVAW